MGQTKGQLYLIPTPIGDTEVYDVMPLSNQSVMRGLDYFVVENVRSARRFLSKAGIGKPIYSLTFSELNEHTLPEEVEGLLRPLLEGHDVGLLSEAGLPAVADPGAALVLLAHKHEIRVIPLVGPSSIMLALMSSGLNGQSFAFNGYLPVKNPERAKAIKFFEHRAIKEKQSQIFIEAPYRNVKLFEDLVSLCAPHTKLTIAADILQPNQFIETMEICQWRGKKPDINKRPAIFIIG